MAGCLTTVPLVEDEITSSSPYAVVSAAKDGVFVPHRMMGPTFDFVRTLPSNNRVYQDAGFNTFTIDNTTSNAQHIGVFPRFTTGSGTYSGSLPWWAATVWGTAARPDDTGFDCVTTGVSIFRGLNPEATITVIAHVGMECILRVESPFRTLAGEPDEPDPRALSAYFEIAARMPHAYPASYNALGLVLPAIAAAVRAIAPHLPKVWEGVKAVAPIAIPALAGLLKAEEKKVEKRVERKPPRAARDAAEELRAGPARPMPRPRLGRSLPKSSKQRIFAAAQPLTGRRKRTGR